MNAAALFRRAGIIEAGDLVANVFDLFRVGHGQSRSASTSTSVFSLISAPHLQTSRRLFQNVIRHARIRTVVPSLMPFVNPRRDTLREHRPLELRGYALRLHR